MKKLLVIFLLLFSVCANAQIENVLPKKPAVPKLVNDFANFLTSEQEEALEQKLVAYDDSTSNQIAIVTLESITDQRGVEYEDEEVWADLIDER